MQLKVLLTLFVILEFKEVFGSQSQCISRGGRCMRNNKIAQCNGQTESNLCSRRKFCCIPTTEPSTTTSSSGGGGSTAPPSGGDCGVKSSSRIVGGSDSNAHNWPWQLSLQKTYYGTLYHICGATLIDSEWAITAAHCVEGDKARDFVVYAGLHHQDQKDQATRTNVNRIITHERYNGGASGFPNDIALLHLSTSIPRSAKIAYACLPHETQDFEPQHTCYITGWGDTKSSTQESKILQELDIDVTPQATCADMWGSTYIKDTHICVGTGLKGACNGDSGGPLQCIHNGKWYVAGATSWGRVGCKTQGYPSVYTRISKFVTWIQDKRATFSAYN